jgi:hypothetical protein
MDRENRKKDKFTALKRDVGGAKKFVPNKKSKHVLNAQRSHSNTQNSANISQNRSEASQLTEQELFEKFKKLPSKG